MKEGEGLVLGLGKWNNFRKVDYVLDCHFAYVALCKHHMLFFVRQLDKSL